MADSSPPPPALAAATPKDSTNAPSLSPPAVAAAATNLAAASSSARAHAPAAAPATTAAATTTAAAAAAAAELLPASPAPARATRYFDIRADTPHARWRAAALSTAPAMSFAFGGGCGGGGGGGGGAMSPASAVGEGGGSPQTSPIGEAELAADLRAWVHLKLQALAWQGNMRRVLHAGVGRRLSRDEWLVIVGMLRPRGPGGLLETQRLALGTIFADTDGRNWRFKAGMQSPSDTPLALPHTNAFGSGNLDDPVVSSGGISSGGISSAFGRTIVMIKLQRNNLKGRLPSEAGLLRSLVHWDTSNNRLTGPLPWQLGGLRRLRTLKVERNAHTGVLPPGLARLTVRTCARTAAPFRQPNVPRTAARTHVRYRRRFYLLVAAACRNCRRSTRTTTTSPARCFPTTTTVAAAVAVAAAVRAVRAPVAVQAMAVVAGPLR
jgi:hypothetical protein